MTRIRCPQKRCIYWDAGYCGAELIELDLENLACMTFEDAGAPLDDAEDDELLEAEELEWEDDESIFDDELDESLYGSEDDEDDDDDLDFLDDDDDDDDETKGWK